MAALLTPNKSRLSSRCRGTTVTISISHKNATSIGVRPGGKGKAMSTSNCVTFDLCSGTWRCD